MLVAQAIGRWGNYFNQELFGRPTDLPWGLEIDAAHRPAGYEQFATFHPTFLYESLWNLAALGAAGLGRPPVPARPRPGVRALRDALHRRRGAGSRYLRIDTSSWTTSRGLRFNVWTSIVLFVLAAAYFVWSRAPTARAARRRPW